MAMSYANGGIRNKYRIEKMDGTPIDSGARYFVLRVDSDPHARVAVAAYAESVHRTNPVLAQQLRTWLDELRG